MQPAPSPSAGRGEVVLQPSYFTSVLYVHPLRDDISTLVQLYREQYASRAPTLSPFALFKQLWCSEGWNWLHFRVFDDRSRETFLLVTMRIFLERITGGDPLARVVGLFGVYTFYYTQPSDTAPVLRGVNHIPIPIDHLTALSELSEGLISAELAPLREPVLYITSRMVEDQIFYILPASDLGAENPRVLPREVVADEAALEEPDGEGPKKKGRPSRRDKAKKARAALEGLNTWLERSPSPAQEDDDFGEYEREKAELLAGDKGAVQQASMTMLGRLQALEAAVGGAGWGSGVERVGRAVDSAQAGGSGVFGLLGQEPMGTSCD